FGGKLKVTRSKPTSRYPYRIPIVYWKYVGLKAQSYVQYDWYNEIPPTVRFRKFYGIKPLFIKGVAAAPVHETVHLY
ncbi:hypothetical protein, partial [Geobacillus stearothermophilus]|uniref:hypothetical protein n=1 Tax=Geobacillus stearothermophilus TaxID=1422 RepID=UPI003D1DE34E